MSPIAGDAGDPLNVAMVGYGFGGRVFHAPLIAANPDLRLVAVATPSETRREQVRAELPSVRVFADLDRLLNEVASVDVVVVTTPNRFHFELARTALEYGIPAVVDKPIAATSMQARQLIEVAESRSLMLTVYQNRRWDGDFLTVRRLIAEGRLGTVSRLESRFERWRPTVHEGWKNSSEVADGGGVLFDLGSHLVDQSLMALGPVNSVYAEVDTRRFGARGDDDVFVALSHDSGARSHLWMSLVCPQVGPRMTVLGDRAAYTTFGMDPQEADLLDGRRPGGAGWGRVPAERWGCLGIDGSIERIETDPGDYPAFYSAVVDAIRFGSSPPVDPRDALRVLEVLETARLSAGKNSQLLVPAEGGDG